MAYGDFKYLTTATASEKILRDRAFSIAKISKYDGYQKGIASMLQNIFDKKNSGGVATLADKSAVTIKICLIKN